MTSYTDGFSYENFIRRAFKCPRGTKHGADSQYMTNLINSENGKNFVIGQSTEKQFTQIKSNVVKAFDKFLSFKLSEEEKQSLFKLKQQTESSYSSSDLLSIISKALESTQRFNN